MADNNPIMDTDNVAEILGLEPDEDISDMSATTAPTGAPMEFHVQMRGHTFGDMQELIVQAAAQQLIGRFGGVSSLQKQIEAKCIDLISAKADAALAGVTAEIIDQPLTPSFGDKKPITMREFIGLTGREFLSERVNREGKPSKETGWGSNNTYTRTEFLVMTAMDRKFQDEIQKATSETIREIQTAIKSAHQAVLEKQKARIRAALATATGDSK